MRIAYLAPLLVGSFLMTDSNAQSLWIPPQKTSWQYQLQGTVDKSVSAQMFDIDLFDTPAADVADLHSRSAKVVCYLSAGSYENWRPDASSFPSTVLGRNNGWPGEQWLDIRRLDILGPIMQARMKLCVSKGFDAVEADNVDGYSNKTGFPLTYQDQKTYNRYLADMAHSLGLSIALKNDVEQIGDLLDVFDFTINEQCFEYKECALLTPFINAGKAVFNVEYRLKTSQFCPQSITMKFNSIRKKIGLDAYRETC